jgi:hypothetical protein
MPSSRLSVRSLIFTAVAVLAVATLPSAAEAFSSLAKATAQADGGFAPSVDSVGGTGFTTSGLASATQDTIVVVPNVGSFPSHAEASSSARTRGGSLAAFAQVDGFGGQTATAEAQYSVLVHLLGPAGATTVDISYFLVVHGEQGAGGGSFASWTASIDAIVPGPGPLPVLLSVDQPKVPTFAFSPVNQELVLDATNVPVTNGRVDVTVGADLIVQASGGCGAAPSIFDCIATADFSHTGELFQVLPPGWTYTTDSGDVGFATPSAVPEPSALFLVSIGLVAFGGPVWRRHLRS